MESTWCFAGYFPNGSFFFVFQISIGYPLIMLALFALIVILQEHLAYGKPPYDVWPDVRKVINGETDCSINVSRFTFIFLNSK